MQNEALRYATVHKSHCADRNVEVMLSLFPYTAKTVLSLYKFLRVAH